MNSDPYLGVFQSRFTPLAKIFSERAIAGNRKEIVIQFIRHFVIQKSLIWGLCLKKSLEKKLKESSKTGTQLIAVRVPRELVSAIDKAKKQLRVKSRSKVIIELLRDGLESGRS